MGYSPLGQKSRRQLSDLNHPCTSVSLYPSIYLIVILLKGYIFFKRCLPINLMLMTISGYKNINISFFNRLSFMD